MSMTKKSKVMDLNPKPVKISSEHLESLQELVNDINAIQFRIGSVEASKHSLLHHFSEIQESVSRKQEELKNEYGTFDVDLKDGTINYPEDGEPRN